MSLSRRFPQVLLATEKAGCAGQCVKGPVLTLVRSAWSGQPLPLIPHWLPALPAVGTGLPGLRSRRASVSASRVPGSPSSSCPGYTPHSGSVSLGFSPPHRQDGGRRREGEGDGAGRSGQGACRPHSESPAELGPGVGCRGGAPRMLQAFSQGPWGLSRHRGGRKAGLAEGRPAGEGRREAGCGGSSRASSCLITRPLKEPGKGMPGLGKPGCYLALPHLLLKRRAQATV